MPETHAADHIEREDLMMFINACFACTGQSEFYAGAASQRLSSEFLHAYIHGNYPRLYTLCLAAGINDYNKAEIVYRLLRAGAPAQVAERQHEGRLIAATLRRMPPQRVYRLFDRLRRTRVNNRRTRAVIRQWLAGRDAVFDAVKYRNRLRFIARHAHLAFDRLTGNPEVGEFVFAGARSRKQWQASLFETVRRAWYEEAAIYELPYTIAEGFASRRRIPRERFLQRIESRMTVGERQRLEQAGRRARAKLAELDLARMPLTRLALYILSRPREERGTEREAFEAALRKAALRALRRAPLRLPAHVRRVCAVLDCSFSSRASTHKPNRPLAVALGAHELLGQGGYDYRGFWTQRVRDPLLVSARGQSNLARPLIDALRCSPDLIVIISDGFENDLPGATDEVIRIYRERIEKAGTRTSIVHLNPVFDDRQYMPRALSSRIPTLGLRDAEDIATALGFARFADGTLSLVELEAYLRDRADDLIRSHDQSHRNRGDKHRSSDKLEHHSMEAVS